MLTAEQSRQFRQADADLDTLTVERLLDLLAVLSVTDGQEFVAGIMDTMPALVAELGDVSALLAASAYELSREQSDVRSRFVVNLSDPPGVEQVQKSVRWVLAPLWSPENVLEPDKLTSLLTDRLSASVPRLVREGGRLTTVDNTVRDPARPRYQRVASAQSCDWCKMLAGRGAVYHTKDSAGVGRKFHDHDSCRVELIFT